MVMRRCVRGTGVQGNARKQKRDERRGRGTMAAHNSSRVAKQQCRMTAVVAEWKQVSAERQSWMGRRKWAMRAAKRERAADGPIEGLIGGHMTVSGCEEHGYPPARRRVGRASCMALTSRRLVGRRSRCVALRDPPPCKALLATWNPAAARAAKAPPLQFSRVLVQQAPKRHRQLLDDVGWEKSECESSDALNWRGASSKHLLKLKCPRGSTCRRLRDRRGK